MKHNLLNLSLVLALLLLAGLGCRSVTKAKPSAEKAVVNFHQMLAEDRHAEIYDQSSDVLKRQTTREDMLKVFRVVNSKLGPAKSTKLQTWNVGNYNLVTTATLIYETEFEHGKGTEQFVFEINGDEAKLAGYHVNSLDLFSE
jgi:hypothetical protein